MIRVSEKQHEVGIGEEYGYWAVIGEEDYEASSGWGALCECYCGMRRRVVTRKLVNGKSKSCGCGQVHDSIEAMLRLRRIYDSIPTYLSTWGGYEHFKRWALYSGYTSEADLVRQGFGYGPATCSWSPTRVPKKVNP